MENKCNMNFTASVGRDSILDIYRSEMALRTVRTGLWPSCRRDASQNKSIQYFASFLMLTS